MSSASTLFAMVKSSSEVPSSSDAYVDARSLKKSDAYVARSLKKSDAYVEKKVMRMTIKAKAGLVEHPKKKAGLVERPPFLRYYIYNKSKSGGWLSDTHVFGVCLSDPQFCVIIYTIKAKVGVG